MKFPFQNRTQFIAPMKSRTLSLSLALAASVLCSLQANAALAHRWSFDNNQDSVGGANLNLVGGASFTGGQLELPGGGARTNYASAPGITGTLASSQSVTIEAWFTLDTLQNWSKVWMFGTAGAQPAFPTSTTPLTPDWRGTCRRLTSTATLATNSTPAGMRRDRSSPRTPSIMWRRFTMPPTIS